MRAVELTYTFFSPDTFLESGGKWGRLGKGVCAKLCKARPSFAERGREAYLSSPFAG